MHEHTSRSAACKLGYRTVQTPPAGPPRGHATSCHIAHIPESSSSCSIFLASRDPLPHCSEAVDDVVGCSHCQGLQPVHKLLQLIGLRAVGAVSLLCCYCWGVVQLQALGQCCKYNCAVSLPLQSFEVNAMFLTDEGCACLAADEVQEYVYIGSGSDLPKTVEIVVRHCCWRWLQCSRSNVDWTPTNSLDHGVHDARGPRSKVCVMSYLQRKLNGLQNGLCSSYSVPPDTSK